MYVCLYEYGYATYACILYNSHSSIYAFMRIYILCIYTNDCLEEQNNCIYAQVLILILQNNERNQCVHLEIEKDIKR